MRLIDADKLIMYVADCKLSKWITWYEAELITDFILNSPTIESKPKGKWRKPRNENSYECPFCDTYFCNIGLDMNYCPCCGADMGGEE